MSSTIAGSIARNVANARFQLVDQTLRLRPQCLPHHQQVGQIRLLHMLFQMI